MKYCINLSVTIVSCVVEITVSIYQDRNNYPRKDVSFFSLQIFAQPAGYIFGTGRKMCLEKGPRFGSVRAYFALGFKLQPILCQLCFFFKNIRGKVSNLLGLQQPSKKSRYFPRDFPPNAATFLERGEKCARDLARFEHTSED